MLEEHASVLEILSQPIGRLVLLGAVTSSFAPAIPTPDSLLLPTCGIISVGHVWLGVLALASIAIAPRLAASIVAPIAVLLTKVLPRIGIN